MSISVPEVQRLVAAHKMTGILIVSIDADGNARTLSYGTSPKRAAILAKAIQDIEADVIEPGKWRRAFGSEARPVIKRRYGRDGNG